MAQLTQTAREKAAHAAQAQGFSAEAGEAMLRSLVASGGYQAQFNHPEFGGMGQWQGGMTQIGDMFNNGLRDRVASLASTLSQLVNSGERLTEETSQGTGYQSTGDGNSGWPAELGSPSSSGSQNDMSYAVFPGTHRLAIRSGGVTKIYDTGDHSIGGVSQSQSGSQNLSFTSQNGTVRLEDLREV